MNRTTRRMLGNSNTTEQDFYPSSSVSVDSFTYLKEISQNCFHVNQVQKTKTIIIYYPCNVNIF